MFIFASELNISLSKMAARSDAAATPGPKNGVLCLLVLSPRLQTVWLYWKSKDKHPETHLWSPEPPGYRQCVQTSAFTGDYWEATRPRARLRANPTSPAIPSLMLSNVRSLENKLDLIKLSRSTQHETRDCCVFVFTETWLNDNIPDSAIQLHGLTCCRADRDSSLSGKTRGGGLCVYINKEWCNNAAVLSKHCSSLVEFMVVKCRPFYLPRSSRPLLLSRCTFPRVQMLRTRFVNCTAPSANNKQITRRLFHHSRRLQPR